MVTTGTDGLGPDDSHESIEAERIRPPPEDFPLPIDDWLEALTRARVHPVLVFGTSFSGKTTMLQSLLSYAMHNPRAGFDIARGTPLFPDNIRVFRQRNSDGMHFYDTSVTEFAQGELPPHTAKAFPFFVPVDIVVKGERLRFAFLEGNGEWFERRDVDDPDQPVFEPFKTEIVGLIRKFKQPLSVIFVAPADIKGEVSKKIKSYEAVANCIDQYKRDLMHRQADQLLLLISKWDLLCDPNDGASHFADATAHDVLNKIKTWKFIWTKFSNIPVARPDAKALMPYCAAWIRGSSIVEYNDSYKLVFDKFNRTLWNWLYGNAVMAKSENKNMSRPNLYDDVNARASGRSRLYLKLASGMLWIGSKKQETV